MSLRRLPGSISGYHIAEAGAKPISQLAFTLASGFTYVETYLARSTEAEEQSQLTRLKDFQARNAGQYRHGMQESALAGRRFRYCPLWLCVRCV